VELANEFLIGVRAVLGPAICVMDQTRRRAARCNGAEQRLHHQMLRHALPMA
jgi:hypothetical protein